MTQNVRDLLATLDAEETISIENLEVLATGLDSEDESLIADILKFIGDLNRQEGNRDVIGGKVDIVGKIVQFLQSKNNSIIQFAARALGNLSYQHQNNRNTLVSLDAPTQFVSLLKSTTEPQIQRNLSGALANVAFISDGLQVQLAEQGVLPLVVDLLQSEDDDVQIMAIRAIANLVDESTRTLFRKSLLFDKVVNLFFSPEGEHIRGDCLSIITSATENCAESLIYFAEKSNWLESLHNIAKNDENEQVRSDAWEFLLALADNGDVKPIFESQGILQKLMNDADPSAAPVPLAATLQILGHLAVHDSCMAIMFESFNVFVNLLTHEDTNVKMYTAMILGNIARKDIYCKRLVESGAVPILHKLCKEEVRIQHLALGALRNISIPIENKQAVIEEEGLVDTILKCISESNNAHVLYNAVLLLKILANGGQSFVSKILQSGNCLEEIEKLLEKPLQDGQERIHYEAARFLVQLLTIDNTLLELVAKHGIFIGLGKLLETKFDILHSEALDTLSLYVNSSSDLRKFVVSSKIVDNLIALLSQPTTTQEIQLKTLVIIANLSNDGDIINQLSANEKTREVLQGLTSSTEEIKTIAQKVLGLLPKNE